MCVLKSCHQKSQNALFVWPWTHTHALIFNSSNKLSYFLNKEDLKMPSKVGASSYHIFVNARFCDVTKLRHFPLTMLRSFNANFSHAYSLRISCVYLHACDTHPNTLCDELPLASSGISASAIESRNSKTPPRYAGRATQFELLIH